MKNTFCGLVDRRPDLDACSRLAGLSFAKSDLSPRVVAGASSGIAVGGSGREGNVVDDGNLVAVVTGTPRWTDQRLESIRRERSLSESLAAAYEAYGVDLLKELRGVFALALLDNRKELALLAIDRVGVCQLYYSEREDGGLHFATEAGPLHELNGSSLSISDQGIYNYLYFHMVPSPGTIFENGNKLLAGERLVVQRGKLSRERYWTPQFSEGTAVNRNDLESELHELLRATVRHAADDTNAGCFLSGGIDSSTVAGMLSEVRNPAQTFTIGFDEEGYDETSFARVTSTHFGTEQNEYFVTPSDVADILPAIAASYDEPFGNSSVVPAYYCARMARERGIETLLAGDGGDELFAGNVRYVTQQVFGIYDRTPQWLKSLVVDPVALKLPGGDRLMPTRKLRSYVTQAQVPMPDRLETYNYFNRSPVEDILHPDFMRRIDVETPAMALRETYKASTASTMLNRMLELDWKFTLADNDLRKVGTMCELAGVSVRYPFLDDDIVEFSTRVPPNMKISRFRLRHFFKHAMRDYLPPEVLKKSKHGFGLPFGVWMKSYEPLRELAYDCLSQIGKRNIIRPEYMSQLINAHQSAHAHYYGEFIWVLMMLELWLTQHQIGYEAGA